MGACCTRQELAKDTLLEKSSIFCSYRDEQKNEEDQISDIFLESLKYDINIFNQNINNLLLDLRDQFISKTKKISFHEIYNIILLYKENYTNSKYILYDVRSSNNQKENFLKNMRRINYLIDELKLINNEKKNNFIRFLKGHIIIIIYPIDAFDKKNLNQPIDYIINLYSLKAEIEINILNTNFKENSLSPFTKKLYDFLDKKNYELLPFILLTYSHLSFFKKEGYIFIKFNGDNFSFDNILEKKNKKNENEKPIIDEFLEIFDVSTIIKINNEELNKNNFKQFQMNNILYKEYDISWNEYDYNKVNLELIGRWIRREIKNGHSIIFNIYNFKENMNNNDNWIITVILLLLLGTNVKPSKLFLYLNEKIIFLNNFKLNVEKNLSKLKSILPNFQILNDLKF